MEIIVEKFVSAKLYSRALRISRRSRENGDRDENGNREGWRG
jgi:hypothetical protein